ncbi:pca operon transcription factor PcaQ [Roseibium porphyridii]|uniref:Pca operon transcription factor PcaQ n=1 Tax=Roseibium porphyridii TaxID=2866279 RepID=A0ABY8F9S9_9HYPH|nr:MULTISPECIES: pca operon transcription factor PcaQ [Stappiaceae]QFT29001.1 HTH-type transcriptional regulator GbpR [Labrenzia sp. THAF82]WFE90005.1 pca operon transcription factor PcaQ [Roseibium sp. KMA01]
MIDRRIKFRHIQCLVEIAQERSLKLAADKLGLTQPAVSKTLKELEEIVGATLMTRNRAGIVLTKQGEVFLHFAQISLASLQQGLDGVEREGAQARATLNVGVLPSVAASLMPPVIREFSEMAPHVMVRIMDGPHSHLIEHLKLGKLDLVIGRLGRPASMEGVSFTQLYSERVDLVVRAGHPLLQNPDIKRIIDWPVIYPPEGAAITPLVERFMIANGVGDIPNKIETVSGAFGRIYTRRTDAVWIISSGVVQNETADGHLVRLPFDTDITKGPVGLMTRPETPQRPEEQVFRLAVQRVIEDLMLSS